MKFTIFVNLKNMIVQLVNGSFDFNGKSDQEINYEIMEFFVKPLIIKIRQQKQNHKITEVYCDSAYNLPNAYIELIEKLTNVKIISDESNRNSLSKGTETNGNSQKG